MKLFLDNIFKDKLNFTARLQYSQLPDKRNANCNGWKLVVYVKCEERWTHKSFAILNETHNSVVTYKTEQSTF